MRAFVHGSVQVGQESHWLYKEVDPSGLTAGYNVREADRFSGRVEKITSELECWWHEVEVAPV